MGAGLSFQLQEGATLGNADGRKAAMTREDQIPRRAAAEDGWAEHEACWELKVRVLWLDNARGGRWRDGGRV